MEPSVASVFCLCSFFCLSAIFFLLYWAELDHLQTNKETRKKKKREKKGQAVIYPQLSSYQHL